MPNSEFLIFIVVIAAAYLAGSVNFSILAFRIIGREDPRLQGSGNPGATNVYRQAGIGWAAMVLLLDMARAIAVAVVAKKLLIVWQVPWVGLGLIVGNRFPCFHHFKGGKGVANYLGFTLGIVPVWALIGALAWGVTQLIWRTPFISSFSMVFFLSAGTAVATNGWGAFGAVATAVFIVGCHHQNIREKWH
ncbi:MAG: glycerol-3-phosphate acyltransferase [Desulfosarcina sp.]|jgi:glycerol-3-phosphate acyltransferase PlsY